jgi:hypothetical protein
MADGGPRSEIPGVVPSSPPRLPAPPTSVFARLIGPDGTLVAVVTCLGAMLAALVPLVNSYDRIEHVIGPRWALAVLVLGLIAAIAAVVAGFGHSLVNLFPPTAAEQPTGTAPQVVVGAVAGKETSMSNLNLMQDLQILGALIGDIAPVKNAILADLGSVVAGQPVTTHPIPIHLGKLGEVDITVTAKISPTKDAPSFNVMSLFGNIIADGPGFVAGQPQTLDTFSDKLGSVYLDLTITLALKQAVAAAA